MSSRFSEYKEIIEKKLSEYNTGESLPHGTVYKAMDYSLTCGGKRLRPALLLEFCRLFGGKLDAALPFACALEMIHTYSLIHDDLPAMDNDDLRRGMPTCHIKFGEAQAILAGDALLTRAFEIMTKASLKDPARQLKAINVIAFSSGADGMVGGQVVDLESEGKEISYDTLKYIHRLKTGALIKAACVSGAIIGGADDDSISKVSDFAENLGIAFQIRDDILDVTGNEELLGKPIGSDEESGKSTYVSLFGLARSEELCKEYTEKAVDALLSLGESYDTKELIDLANSMIARNN